MGMCFTVLTSDGKSVVAVNVLYYLDREALSSVFILCEGNPSVSDGFSSLKANNEALWYFCYKHIDAIEQIVETIWRACDVTVMENKNISIVSICRVVQPSPHWAQIIPGRNISIIWLLICLGQHWFCVCKIGKSFLPLRNDFIYQCIFAIGQ